MYDFMYGREVSVLSAMPFVRVWLGALLSPIAAAAHLVATPIGEAQPPNIISLVSRAAWYKGGFAKV